MDNTPVRQRPLSPVRPAYIEDARERDILLDLARKERRVQELKEQLTIAESELASVRGKVMRSTTLKEPTSAQSIFADVAQGPMDPAIVLTRLAEGSRSVFSAVFKDLKELGAATMSDPAKQQMSETVREGRPRTQGSNDERQDRHQPNM